MIYLISDPHGGQDMQGVEEYRRIRREGDLLIVLGDLELCFRDTEDNRRFSEEFLASDYDIAFVDGNHENFDHLFSFPEEEWNGGRVHRLTPHIVHLMRGQIFTIEGMTFFTMGGCQSSQKWHDAGLWWPQEDPNEEEIADAYRHLSARDNRVDYILTHYYKILDPAEPNTLVGLVQYIDREVEFKHWYAGHWHKTERMDEKHSIVFNEPIALK